MALKEIYTNMQNRIRQKVGELRKTEMIDGFETITKDRPATISWSPYQDLKMIYYFENIENYGVDCTRLVESIRKNTTKEL